MTDVEKSLINEFGFSRPVLKARADSERGAGDSLATWRWAVSGLRVRSGLTLRCRKGGASAAPLASGVRPRASGHETRDTAPCWCTYKRACPFRGSERTRTQTSSASDKEATTGEPQIALRLNGKYTCQTSLGECVNTGWGSVVPATTTP
eukprot:366015-Chlamydomonas_euryale.AAC.6